MIKSIIPETGFVDIDDIPVKIPFALPNSYFLEKQAQAIGVNFETDVICGNITTKMLPAGVTSDGDYFMLGSPEEIMLGFESNYSRDPRKYREILFNFLVDPHFVDKFTQALDEKEIDLPDQDVLYQFVRTRFIQSEIADPDEFIPSASFAFFYKSRPENIQESLKVFAGIVDLLPIEGSAQNNIMQSLPVYLLNGLTTPDKNYETIANLLVLAQRKLIEDIRNDPRLLKEMDLVVELHEQSHATRLYTRKFRDKLIAIAHERPEFAMLYPFFREANVYVEELQILDETIATFHSLTGERIVGRFDSLLSSPDLKKFNLFHQLFTLAENTNKVAVWEVDLEAKRYGFEGDIIKPHVTFKADIPDSLVEAAVKRLFDGKYAKPSNQVEEHVSAAIILLFPEYFFPDDERLMHGDTYVTKDELFKRIVEVFNDPDSFLAKLSPDFYDRIVAAHRAKCKKLEDFINSFEMDEA